MTVIQGLILGIAQGLSEFLPISSSGHLALLQYSFEGFEQPGLLYDTMLHFATLLAVFVFFRERILALIKAALGLVFNRFYMHTTYQKPNILKFASFCLNVNVSYEFARLFFVVHVPCHLRLIQRIHHQSQSF